MHDATLAAVVADMLERAGEQATRQWLAAMGMRAALADMDRRDAVSLAVRLLREGQSRPMVRDRLTARGTSRRSAYRAIDAALCQLRPPIGTHGPHDDSIATRTPAP